MALDLLLGTPQPPTPISARGVCFSTSSQHAHAGHGHPGGSEGCPAWSASLGPLVPLSFWDWEKGEKLDYFHNGNPRYTRVTAMEYLNGQDCSLLLTATGEWGPRGRGPGRTRVRDPSHVFW